MKLPLARVIADLRGNSSRRFVELLAGQLTVTAEGAKLVERAARGQLDWATAREAMTEVEHRGDQLRERLVIEISNAIVTPIDREDLFRISRSVDDILDNLRDFLREADLFAIRRRETMVPVVVAIDEAANVLREAILAIASEPRQISYRTLLAKKAGNRIRRAYDLALTEVFAGQLDMEVLKVREVLRRLDVVGLRLGEAADALSDAAVKRSAVVGRIAMPEE